MSIEVSFADLTHTGQTVSANTFPLGMTMVAAYAKQELGDLINMEVFRYPEDYSAYLDRVLPQIACFSVFSWNVSLAHEFAKHIKAFSPRTIAIFGGVNFPTDPDEQKEFLQRYPAIDFYLEGEGELAVVNLIRTLLDYDLDCNRLKGDRPVIANARYLVDGEMIAGEMLPRIETLDIIPSAFDNGLSDKFFDAYLTPMVQTTRGCPYSCTFCSDARPYYNKTRRFSMDRVKREIEYVAKRAKVNEFIITDLNFGMFREDVEVARYVREMQDKYDYPRYLIQATAKNHKERIIQISSILQGTLAPSASVQSTDPEVLKAIKRKNLPVADLIEVSATRVNDNASSRSEVILGLPGDTVKAHIQSNVDMIDAGITLLRNHQFMLLIGTEAASKAARRDYQLQTRFRVQPRCFGHYSVRGEKFSTAEIEEICIANRDIDYHEYKYCRVFDLTIEIFINDALFFDLLQFVDRLKIKRSDFLLALFQRIMASEGALRTLYQEFQAEEKSNLWDDCDALRATLHQPETIEKYISGDLGNNEIYKYRALAVYRNMAALHDAAYSAIEALAELPADSKEALYLKELKRFSLMRKDNFLDTGALMTDHYSFDFVAISENNYADDPLGYYREQPVAITGYHSERQIDMIGKWLEQYGTTINGLGRMFSRAQISAMYRSIRAG